MDDVFSLRTCLTWFDMLLASLDCYCWAIGQALVTPDILSGKTIYADASEAKCSNLYEYFVTFVFNYFN